MSLVANNLLIDYNGESGGEYGVRTISSLIVGEAPLFTNLMRESLILLGSNNL